MLSERESLQQIVFLLRTHPLKGMILHHQKRRKPIYSKRIHQSVLWRGAGLIVQR